MNRRPTNIERLALAVRARKNAIVKTIKEERKIMKQIKKANGEEDKQALLKQAREKRNQIERMRLALNDFTYAFIEQYKSSSGLRLAKKLGFQTAEGYLEARRNGDQPKLALMIEALLDNMMTYSYDADNKLVRRYQGKTIATPYLIMPPMDQRKLDHIAADASKHR